MRQGGVNGGNRFNPLLSGSNGRPIGERRTGEATEGDRGMSIIGAGRRASAAEDSHRDSFSRDRRGEDEDRPPRRRREDDDEDMRN